MCSELFKLPVCSRPIEGCQEWLLSGAVFEKPIIIFLPPRAVNVKEISWALFVAVRLQDYSPELCVGREKRMGMKSTEKDLSDGLPELGLGIEMDSLHCTFHVQA